MNAWVAGSPTRRGLEAWVTRWSEPLFAAMVLTWLWGLTVQARVPMSAALITVACLTLVRGLGTPTGRAHVLTLRRRPDYLLPAGLFVAYALVLVWTQESAYAWGRVAFAAQGLLIPVAFYVWRDHFAHWRRAYWLAVTGFAAAAALAVGVYAFANQSALVVALGQGRAVPVPQGQHVPFAVAMAFAAVTSLHVAVGSRAAPRWWGVVCGCVCAAVLHAVAVRTGLVLLYAGAAGYGLRLCLRRWSVPVAVGAVAAATLVAGALATQVPSVERRLAYARYDVERATGAEAEGNSDGGRVLSFRAAAAVVADDPLLGAGSEGLGRAMDREYDRLGHEGQRHGPTNQWLFSWAHAGLAGLVGVFCVLLGPLWARGWWRRPLLAEAVVMTAAWWLVESPLETDVGAGLALAFVYLAKAYPLVAEDA